MSVQNNKRLSLSYDIQCCNFITYAVTLWYFQVFHPAYMFTKYGVTECFSVAHNDKFYKKPQNYEQQYLTWNWCISLLNKVLTLWNIHSESAIQILEILLISAWNPNMCMFHTFKSIFHFANTIIINIRHKKQTGAVGLHSSLTDHHGLSDLSINILEFIRLPPQTTRTFELTLTFEKHWIHQLICPAPRGVNIFD